MKRDKKQPSPLARQRQDLHRAAEALQQTHAPLVSFLTTSGRDPDVERQLEGMAWMNGQLQGQLEDQLPILTHHMLTLLWPYFLRPTPSMTVLEWQPDSLPGQGDASAQIARGATVVSIPLPVTTGEETLRCHFRTCRNTRLWPLQVWSVAREQRYGTDSLCLHLVTTDGRPLDLAALNGLRLYLGEDTHTGQQLLLWLSEYLSRATLEIEGDEWPLPEFTLTPVGFTDEEALLPWPQNADPGYRLLQEQACFPDAFLFMDVTGFPTLPPLQVPHGFTLRFTFSRSLPSTLVLNRQTVRLHCTPAINLFTHYSDGVNLDGTQSDLPLSPSVRHPEDYDVFSVDEVTGVSTLSDTPRHYVPFERFTHQHGAGYYHLRVSPAAKGGLNHHLAVVRHGENLGNVPPESVSVRLTCSHRRLPLLLKVGEIHQPASGCPPGARVHNITRPSVPLSPRLDATLQAALLRNLSLNSRSLLTLPALRQVLGACDLPAWHSALAAGNSRRRRAGLLSLTVRPAERVIDGVPIDGLASVLTVRLQGAFDSEGELYLYCRVLARFLAQRASVNHFHTLTVLNQDNQESYTFL
ncbi:type VI secretion system baseplate subunit TssF [Edaphovirga cremea]|uniref:type VI secretion system baseplate subunit TssF n=1 Tax=Edaphovirga cremea TaxID=2267246 RepID=UPI003989926B